MFRTLQAMLALLIVMATLGQTAQADGGSLPFPGVNYNSKEWLSRSLARVNLGRILAQRSKPWVMAQLPMALNLFYSPGENAVISAKVRYIFTVPPLKPLKSVLWIEPVRWPSSFSSNSETQAVRHEYRHQKKAEYLRSFQGLVIFRVNEKVRGMHQIDPIWQISEKWQGMVKPAWLFCKKHKRWFLKGGVAKHTADLKKLLANKNLLLAANAFRLLCQSDHFRKEMFAGKLFAYNGVRLGAFTELLIVHASHANLVHPKHLAARMGKLVRKKSQRPWLAAGAIEAGAFTEDVPRSDFGGWFLPKALNPNYGKWP